MAVFKYFLVFFASLQAASGFKFAFIIIDVQNCFLKGGSLAVKNGDDVIPTINDILKNHRNDFSLVVLTQDWHCANHVSFASQHPGKSPYETVLLKYNKQGELCSDSNPCDTIGYNVTQTLWPDHCVMNTTSANLSSMVNTADGDIIIRKGYNCDVDSYSAFYDNGGFDHTELQQILKKNNITHVMITGLALDYCVYYTAKDAKKLGYTTYVVEDACRGVAQDTVEYALKDMREKGISTVQYRDVDRVVSGSYSGGSVHRQNYLAILLQTIAVLSVGMMTNM